MHRLLQGHRRASRRAARLALCRTIIGSQIAQFASIWRALAADCVELRAARSRFGGCVCRGPRPPPGTAGGDEQSPSGTRRAHSYDRPARDGDAPTTPRDRPPSARGRAR
ncbi:hypothetical protein BURMUCGD1_4938 [Burkholderia multivorans CGD1]|nr:hypothetical protein BURMUCGD1_4938 [Burkholderia multivorans CGD1]